MWIACDATAKFIIANTTGKLLTASSIDIFYDSLGLLIKNIIFCKNIFQKISTSYHE
jgi:hypothetical protein